MKKALKKEDMKKVNGGRQNSTNFLSESTEPSKTSGSGGD